MNNRDDHHNEGETDVAHAHRNPAGRDELANFQESLLDTSFAPLGFQSQGHHAHNINAGYAYNAANQQAYQQDHGAYGHYPSQGYYFQNHYDPHAQADYYGHQDGIDFNNESLDLMWSDQVGSRSRKPSNMTAGQLYSEQPKPAQLYNKYERENEAELYNANYLQEVQRKQMMSMQNDLNRHPIRKPMDAPLHGINPMAMDPLGFDAKNAAAKQRMNAAIPAVKFNPRVSSPKRMSGMSPKSILI